MSENDLLDLKSLGKKDDQIIFKKIESPIGTTLKTNGHTILVNSEPKKKSRGKIKLAEEITVGKKVVKICLKKREKCGERKVEEFYSTKSYVERILHDKASGKYFIFTKNSKYEVIIK